MKSLKYKCNNCGHEFFGDLSTSECPECGSQEIKPIKSGFPKWLWVVIAAMAFLIIMLLLFKSCSHEEKIIGKLDNVSSQAIKISIKGVSARDLSLKYYILANNDKENPLVYRFVGKDNSLIIYKSKLTPGTTYSFVFIETATKSTPKDFKWEGSNTYYHPLPPRPPQIDTVLYHNPDYKSQSYERVEVILKNDSTQEGLEYYLDNEKQSSSEFNGVTVGLHEIIVKNNKALSDTFDIILPQIAKPAKKVTIEEMNDILDLLHRREIEIGKARTSISPKKDIRLKTSIDGAKTLYEVMQRTRQEGANSYKVVSCEYDENNRIIQGSLVLERK